MRPALVTPALGIGQLIAWGSSFYLPAVLAAPQAASLGCAESSVYLAFSCAMAGSAAVGPAAGRAIDRVGGQPVLVGASLLFAVGLGLMSQVDGLVGLFLAWAVIGLAMGAGLYESAFATVVRLYGRAGSDRITVITLWGGFASTVGWPLSAWMEANWGWRGACIGWALIHLLGTMPLHASLPGSRVEGLDSSASPVRPSDPDEDITTDTVASESPAGSHAPSRHAIALLAFLFAATWFVTTAFAAHGPRLLQELGLGSAFSVLLAALVGPAQVAGRLLQLGPLRRVDPLKVAAWASLGHPLGAVLLLLAGPLWAPVFVLLHGAGGGLMTISRGALPLWLFGPAGYGARQGLLMVPTRITQAVAPYAFGLALDGFGASALWGSVCLSALAWLAVRSLSRR